MGIAAKLLKKITMRDVIGPLTDRNGAGFQAICAPAKIGETPEGAPLYAPKGPTVWLADIYAKINKLKPGTGTYGDFVTLIGPDVQATNLLTGEVFASNKLNVPGFIADQLAAGLTEAQAGDPEAVIVVGLRMGAHYDASAVTGYVYDMLPLTETKRDDPFAALKAEAALRLAAPVATVATDPAPATVATDPAPAAPASTTGKKGGKAS